MSIYLIKIKNMPLLAKKEKGRWVAGLKNPAIFTSKKKGKRILRRLNKYHGGEWILVRL